jgi:transposase InsO family protein
MAEDAERRGMQRRLLHGASESFLCDVPGHRRRIVLVLCTKTTTAQFTISPGGESRLQDGNRHSHSKYDLTVAKWIERFRTDGARGLEDGSSRPRRTPHITPARRLTRIQRLRQRHGLPAWAISRALGVPRSTVSAWLRRLGLNHRPAAPAVPVQRYEWPAGGDLLHVDIKPLGCFRQPGHRVHGDRRRASPQAGWEYVHVAVDDHSRLAYVEVRRDQHGITCAAFLQRAVAWFARRHVVVRRVLSDNGSGYVSRVFATACSELALRHLRTHAYTPRTNGKAERFIQTLLREWAYVAPYRTSVDRRRALRPWLRFYNDQRPHAGLNYLTPWSRLQRAA